MLAILACLLLLLLITEPATLSRRSPPANSMPPILDDDISPLSPENQSKSPSTTSLRGALLQKNVLLALPVFLTGSLRYTILNVLIQYSSNRFSLKISKGAFFYTETAIVNIFLFLLLVPILTGYLRTKYDIRPPMIDLFM